MQYARDNLDLDPHWHLCAGCDRDGAFTPDAHGLCPECAARKNMAERIWSHYDHAREKHPYFCDRIISLSETGVEALIKLSRRILAIEVETGNVEPGDVLECEFYEAMQAYTHGDKAHAVEELYDCIAVLLRTIDVLEGRQPLGKPEQEGAAQ